MGTGWRCGAELDQPSIRRAPKLARERAVPFRLYSQSIRHVLNFELTQCSSAGVSGEGAFPQPDGRSSVDIREARSVEAWIGLIGAITGSVTTSAAVWWQTGRLLENERQRLREVFDHERALARQAADDARQLARQAAEDDRQAARAAITAHSAGDLLEALHAVEHALYNFGRSDDNANREQAEAALDLLSEADATSAALLPERVRRRWHHLRMLIGQLDAAYPVPDSVTPANPADWTTNKIGRARDDIQAYIGYVRRTLVAVVDDAAIPPDAPMPVLHRTDWAVWLLPDEGGPTV